MAIVFLQKEKAQRNLILIFLAIILIMAYVIWSGFFKKEKELVLEEIPFFRPAEVEINFNVFKMPLLQDLREFSEIKPFEEKIGRENPFLPF